MNNGIEIKLDKNLLKEDKKYTKMGRKVHLFLCETTYNIPDYEV